MNGRKMIKAIAFCERIKLLPLPRDEEMFQLQVDYGFIDPLSVVVAARAEKQGWRYAGPIFNGQCNIYTRLMRFGCGMNLAKAEERTKDLGYKLLPSHAREAITTQYAPDEESVIVFGGAQFRSPSGVMRTPFIVGDKNNSAWKTGLYYSADKWDINPHWAVIVSEVLRL